MYSAGFYPHETQEELWGYWCKHIYHNRYHAQLNALYPTLFSLMKGQNYFVLTTNADHLFRLNGFEKERIFYTQGDYGLFQCEKACHNKTYDNEAQIMEMVANLNDLKIPTALLPKCPVCGGSMSVNLRKDEFFVEDHGWKMAMRRYLQFLQENEGKHVLFLELGVGYNTPTIIKYPFWQMTYENPNATFVTINQSEAKAPKEIEPQSICVQEDIAKVLEQVLGQASEKTASC